MNFSFFIITLFFKGIVPQILTLCRSPEINSACVLKCKTPDLKKTVLFRRQRKTFGTCTIPFERPICRPTNNRFLIDQDGTANVTSLTIKNLDKKKDEGAWHCEYGNGQSENQELRVFDNIYNITDPIVTARNDSFHFPSHCLMSEPTASLECRTDEYTCKVSTFQNQNCENPNLRMYNIACNNTSECFFRNRTKVYLKAYGFIIEQRVILYKTKSLHNDTEHEDLPSDKQGINVAAVIIGVLMSIVIIVGIILILKYKENLKKVCKGRKMATNSAYRTVKIKHNTQDTPNT